MPMDVRRAAYAGAWNAADAARPDALLEEASPSSFPVLVGALGTVSRASGQSDVLRGC